MLEYVVECIRLTEKIGKCKTNFIAESPRHAVERFINMYLLPIDEPLIHYGGLSYEEEKYLSYKLTLKDVPDMVFMLNCRYLGEKLKYTKNLP